MSSPDDLRHEVGARRRGAKPDAGGRSGRLAGLRSGAGRVFSPRGFLLALATLAAGLVLAGSVVPDFIPVGGMLGVFLAAFGLGAVGRRRYVEIGLAGAAVAGVALLVDHLAFTLLGGVGLPLAAFGATAGALAALLGHYFGRDLRTGLTRDLA